MTQVDPILHDYERKAQDLELEIATATADLALDHAVRTIRESPEWAKCTERMEEIRQGILGTIASKRLDAYELGRYQGYLRAVGAMLSQRPLDDEEVDRRRRDITMRAEQLTEIRNLLT